MLRSIRQSEATAGHTATSSGGKIGSGIFPDKTCHHAPCRNTDGSGKGTRSSGVGLIKPGSHPLEMGDLRSPNHRSKRCVCPDKSCRQTSHRQAENGNGGWVIFPVPKPIFDRRSR